MPRMRELRKRVEKLKESTYFKHKSGASGLTSEKLSDAFEEYLGTSRRLSDTRFMADRVGTLASVFYAETIYPKSLPKDAAVPTKRLESLLKKDEQLVWMYGVLYRLRVPTDKGGLIERAKKEVGLTYGSFNSHLKYLKNERHLKDTMREKIELLYNKKKRGPSHLKKVKPD